MKKIFCAIILTIAILSIGLFTGCVESPTKIEGTVTNYTDEKISVRLTDESGIQAWRIDLNAGKSDTQEIAPGVWTVRAWFHPDTDDEIGETTMTVRASDDDWFINVHNSTIVTS